MASPTLWFHGMYMQVYHAEKSKVPALQYTMATTHGSDHASHCSNTSHIEINSNNYTTIPLLFTAICVLGLSRGSDL